MKNPELTKEMAVDQMDRLVEIRRRKHERHGAKHAILVAQMSTIYKRNHSPDSENEGERVYHWSEADRLEYERLSNRLEALSRVFISAHDHMNMAARRITDKYVVTCAMENGSVDYQDVKDIVAAGARNDVTRLVAIHASSSIGRVQKIMSCKTTGIQYFKHLETVV